MMQSQSQLMQSIYETGLSLDDTILYLDTHPNDMAAMDYYRKLRDAYHEQTIQYSRQYGPLYASKVFNCNNFCWATNPMPWEREA